MKKRFILAGLILAVLLGVGSTTVVAQASTAQPAASSASSAATQPAEKKSQDEDETEGYRHSATVVKLGGMLGMNPEQSATAFEITNFILLAGLVLWFLVRTLPGAIRGRNAEIQKHLVEARSATEDAKTRLSSVEERLGKLDGQIAALRSQAEQDSARDEARMKNTVEEEKNKILSAAEQEIASATVQAHKQLQQYAAELAIEQAAKKLVVSAETDRLLVQSFAQRLAGDESKKGQN